MAVYSQQSDDGVMQAPVAIVNKDGLSDEDLLARKLASHEGYGWAVERTGPTTFTASKIRGRDEPRECTRRFWVD